MSGLSGSAPEEPSVVSAIACLKCHKAKLPCAAPLLSPSSAATIPPESWRIRTAARSGWLTPRPADPHQLRFVLVVSADVRNRAREHVVVVPIFSTSNLGPT